MRPVTRQCDYERRNRPDAAGAPAIEWRNKLPLSSSTGPGNPATKKDRAVMRRSLTPCHCEKGLQQGIDAAGASAIPLQRRPRP